MYSSSPLLYSFAQQCCCNLVRGIGHTSQDLGYRDFEEQSALRFAANTSVFTAEWGLALSI